MPAALAVAAVAGSVYTANKQSKAAKSAAQAQTQAAGDANRLQYDMFQQSRQDNEPFRQNALTAQNEYMALLGLAPVQAPQQGQQGQPQGQQAFGQQGRSFNAKYGPSMFDEPVNGMFNFTAQTGGNTPATQAPAMTPEQAQQAAFERFRNTPGYQFGLDTGRKQLESSAAARGGLYSGAALKALQQYGNDYADQQGYTPYMNRLASLAGMGQTVNNQNAQLGMNYANQAGANMMNAGNARASGIQGSSDAWSNGIGNVVGIGSWLAGQSGSGGTNAYGWRGF